MKKILLILVVCLVFVFFIVQDQKKSPKLDLTYHELENPKIGHAFYYLGETLVGCPFNIVSQNDYALIEEAFSYLSEKQNSVDEEYVSYIFPSSYLISYELHNNEITLNVSSEFLRAPEAKYPLVLNQIYYTFTELGYEKIYIAIEGDKLQSLGNNTVSQGIAFNPYVNASFDTALISDAHVVRIGYAYPNNKLLYTNHFISKYQDKGLFIMNRVLSFIDNNYNKKYILKEYKADDENYTFYFEGELPEGRFLDVINSAFKAEEAKSDFHAVISLAS